MREYIVNLVTKFIGTPYIWGGNSPRVGFDCSGLVVWVLQVFNILPSGDWNSQALSERFRKRDPGEKLEGGDLAFYGGAGYSVTHVMMCIGSLNGVPMCVGASGGNSSTKTPEDAALKDAKVKMKPVNYRKDFLFVVDITSPS